MVIAQNKKISTFLPMDVFYQPYNMVNGRARGRYNSLFFPFLNARLFRQGGCNEKKPFRDITSKIARFIVFGLILSAVITPLLLIIAKVIGNNKTDELKVLADIGLIALLMIGLWGMLWIVRMTSPRVWLVYENFSAAGSGIAPYILAVFCGVVFFGTGAYHFFSNQTLREAQKILDLPELDTTGIATVSKDTLLTFTGVLDDNMPISPDGYVTFIEEKWHVYPCDLLDDEDCSKTTGYWGEIKQAIPGLKITISGSTVNMLPVSQATFGGNLSEQVKKGNNPSVILMAEYNGQRLQDGSIRIRGMRNGDRVTVVGRKDDAGGVIPIYLIGGGRDQLVTHVNAVSLSLHWLRTAGAIMMLLSPFVTLFMWRNNDW